MSDWTFTPPPGHALAWVYAYRGRARVPGETLAGELAVLEEGDAPVTFEADTDVRMLVGSAAKHDHPLVLGRHSVHTSRESLARGEARIREVYAELRSAGRV